MAPVVVFVHAVPADVIKIRQSVHVIAQSRQTAKGFWPRNLRRRTTGCAVRSYGHFRRKAHKPSKRQSLLAEICMAGRQMIVAGDSQTYATARYTHLLRASMAQERRSGTNCPANFSHRKIRVGPPFEKRAPNANVAEIMHLDPWYVEFIALNCCSRKTHADR